MQIGDPRLATRPSTLKATQLPIFKPSLLLGQARLQRATGGGPRSWCSTSCSATIFSSRPAAILGEGDAAVALQRPGRRFCSTLRLSAGVSPMAHDAAAHHRRFGDLFKCRIAARASGGRPRPRRCGRRGNRSSASAPRSPRAKVRRAGWSSSMNVSATSAARPRPSEDDQGVGAPDVQVGERHAARRPGRGGAPRQPMAAGDEPSATKASRRDDDDSASAAADWRTISAATSAAPPSAAARAARSRGLGAIEPPQRPERAAPPAGRGRCQRRKGESQCGQHPGEHAEPHSPGPPRSERERLDNGEQPRREKGRPPKTARQRSDHATTRNSTRAMGEGRRRRSRPAPSESPASPLSLDEAFRRVGDPDSADHQRNQTHQSQEFPESIRARARNRANSSR